MKRLSITLLLIIFVVTAVAGCGSGGGDATPSTQTATGEQATDTAAHGKVNEYGWEVPEKTMEITYYVGQDNPDTVSKNSKLIDKLLLEKFNVKINKIVYDTDMIEKLNLMLASNDYPEVISNMSVTETQKWIDLGKAQELTPLIDEYGSEIRKQMGDYLKRYEDSDKKIYNLPVGWGLLPIADAGAQVRLDWYKEIGSPEFKTPDEYYEVLKKLVEKHPKNAAGEKVYALGTWKDDKIHEQLGGIWGLKYGWKEAPDHSLTHWINTDEGLEFTKWYNRFAREGLLDPDSFTQKRDDWGAKCTNERYAGHFANWWVTKDFGNMAWLKTKKDYNDDMRYPHYNIKAPTAEKSYLNPKSTMGWARTIITDKCTQPENVMKWWNFEVSDMGTKLLSWGIPNTETSVWNLDASGQWSWNQKETKKLEDSTFDQAAFDLNGGVAYWMVMGQHKHGDGSQAWLDQNFPSKWFKFKDENLKDTIFDFSAYFAISLPSDEPVTVQNQQVKDIYMTGFANAVMAKTEQECVAKFMEMREKANKAGLKEVEKFYTQEYKKNLEAWK